MWIKDAASRDSGGEDLESVEGTIGIDTVVKVWIVIHLAGHTGLLGVIACGLLITKVTTSNWPNKSLHLPSKEIFLSSYHKRLFFQRLQ